MFKDILKQKWFWELVRKGLEVAIDFIDDRKLNDSFTFDKTVDDIANGNQ